MNARLSVVSATISGNLGISGVGGCFTDDHEVGRNGLECLRVGLQHYLEALLGCAVDLGTADSLKPRLRARVLAEAVDVG